MKRFVVILFAIALILPLISIAEESEFFNELNKSGAYYTMEEIYHPSENFMTNSKNEIRIDYSTYKLHSLIDNYDYYAIEIQITNRKDPENPLKKTAYIEECEIDTILDCLNEIKNIMIDEEKMQYSRVYNTLNGIKLLGQHFSSGGGGLMISFDNIELKLGSKDIDKLDAFISFISEAKNYMK